MSAEGLTQYLDLRVFDSFPSLEDLAVYHVPFGEFIAGCSIEAALLRAVRNAERVALTGPSGSGKSSIIATALGPLQAGIAPITVPVFSENPRVATDAMSFLGVVVRTITRYLRDAYQITDSERERMLQESAPLETLASSSKQRSATVGLPSWALKAQLATQLTSVVAGTESGRTTPEVADVVQQAIAVIKRDGLQPVIVVDDSDRWLASAARPTPEPIVTAFFGDVLREVAQLDCSLVVAVHPHYRDMLPRPSGVLVPINVPTLPDATALELMLQGRAHRCGAEEGLTHILAPDALDHAFRHYANQGSFNIRRVLAVLHNALLHSQQGRGGRITVDDIAYAVSQEL